MSDSVSLSKISKAIKERNLNEIKLLLPKDADDELVNAMEMGSLKTTPLNYAIEQKKFKIAEWILGLKNVDVNGKDKYGRTTLMYAVSAAKENPKECRKIVIQLLKNPKIDVNAKDKYGFTAMGLTVYLRTDEECRSFIELLTKKGADPNFLIKFDTGYSVLLTRLINSNYRKSVKYLVGLPETDPHLGSRNENPVTFVLSNHGSGRMRGDAESAYYFSQLLKCKKLDENKMTKDELEDVWWLAAHEGGKRRLIRALIEYKKFDFNSEKSATKPPIAEFALSACRKNPGALETLEVLLNKKLFNRKSIEKGLEIIRKSFSESESRDCVEKMLEKEIK